MYAVGVDISKGKSTVAVLRSKSEVVVRPFDVAHDTQGFSGLVEHLRGLGGEVRVVMEHTGNFYESIALTLHSAGFYVSAVNPLLIKEYGTINVSHLYDSLIHWDQDDVREEWNRALADQVVATIQQRRDNS